MDDRSNSVAVTASELARVQPIYWNGDSQNSPVTSIDFARIVEKPQVEAYRTYVLRQTSYNTQSLISTAKSVPTSYTIKHHVPGGFRKRRPHIVVTRDIQSRTTRLADVWFDTHGYGNNIVYLDGGVTQHLARDISGQRRFTCLIDGVVYTWQPLGPSRNVLELVTEAGKRAALFVYAEFVCQRSASYSGSPTKIRGVEIGRLHIIDHGKGKQVVFDQICCTAVVLVEKVKQKVSISGIPG